MRAIDMDQHVQQVRSVVRGVAEEIRAFIAAGERDRRIPVEAMRILADSGCLGRTLPTESGGQGDGFRAFAAQQEELAAVWPTAAVACTWANLSGRLITRFAAPTQRAQLIPGLLDGSGLGAVAWTEPQGGSDAAAITTTARRVDGGWVLDGAKRLIDNARDATFLVVGARTGTEGADDSAHHALTMFVVHPDDPGFVFEGAHDTMGLRAAGVGRFRLEQCFVPEERVLGEVGRGFYQMMDMVELGRTGVAAICVGMAEAALGETRAFVSGRHSFGGSLAENGVIVARVAELRVKIDAARLLTERATAMGDSGARCSTEAAMAKLFASEVACEVTAAALHLHGGIGFTAETPVEMLFRDSQAFTIGEGTSEIMRIIIGRDELARP